MKKVTKATIKSLLKTKGIVQFAMLPSKVGIGNMWIKPMEVVVRNEQELENYINRFTVYNCNSEVGNTVHYYIRG